MKSSNEHKEQIANLLLAALQSTVTELPFLAGSIVPFSKEQPWLRDIRAHGAAYLEVRDLAAKISFAELRRSHFSSSTMDTDQLCPYQKPLYIRDHPIYVCRVRANFVDGGLLLVFSIIHTVCDGQGITDFLEIFPEKLRKAQSGEHVSDASDNNTHSYSFDRTLVLSGNRHAGAIENHSGWTASPLVLKSDSANKKTSCITFHISSESLHVLKRVASSSSISSSMTGTVHGTQVPAGGQDAASDHSINISTHDAIAALIWCSIMLARYRAGILSHNSLTHFSQAVDCRTRLGLPKPYFGNAIYGVKASLALPDLAPANHPSESLSGLGLRAAGQAIRTEVNSVTVEKFRDLLGFVERTEMEMVTRPSVLEHLPVASLLLVSYFGFKAHEMDFGEALGGKIEAIRLPSCGLLPGMPVVLPRLPDGSCEFVINEPEEVMRFVTKDATFRRFASKQC